MKPNNQAPIFQPGSDTLIGLAALLRAAYYEVNLTPLGNEMIAYLDKNPGDANVLMDVSTILYLLGQREVAAATQLEAIKLARFYRLPTAAGNQEKLRVLALVTPGDFMANTPLEFLLEDSDVVLEHLYVLEGAPLPDQLPEHDVLFIAVGEADGTHGLLAELAEQTRDWPRPVLNRARQLLNLSRDRVAEILRGAPGICAPMTLRAERSLLQQIADGRVDALALLGDGGFPLIARPVGSHAGQGLQKLEDRAAAATYLQQHGEQEFFISHFVDYSGEDRLFRKYRIVLIEGKPFVCHMAVSEHWMVHYLNAGMGDSAAKRAQEAQAMADFDTGFAERHRGALALVQEKFGLEYVGIDCGETRDGRLLVFEVDTSIIVHAMDPVDVYPYKQDAMRKVFAAFRALLQRTAQARTGRAGATGH